MAQWTIDPVDITGGPDREPEVSSDVCAKAIQVFEARPRVIVHLGHVRLPAGTQVDGFGVPSWTDANADEVYAVNVTTDPNGRREVECTCPATGPCHHGLAALLVLDQLDRRRHLTAIPGGRR